MHKPKGQAAIGFIFVTLLIDVLGFGIIIPVLPDLIKGLIHSDLSAASAYSGILLAVYAGMQFFFAPLIGNLSDKFGRRPVLLFSLLGFSIDYFLTAFAPTIGWLFVGRTIAGVTGASFTTASAYIADVSTPEKRAANFGLVGVAFGVGFILGPMLGGLLGKWDIHYPFLAAGGFALLNALFGYFILPESLPVEKRRAFDIKRCSPWGTLIQLKKYKSVIGLTTSLFLIFLAAQSVQTVWAYFTMYKFNWSRTDVGWSLGFVGLMIGAVQGGLIRVILPKFGNEKSIWMGLLLYTLGLVLFAFASSGWMMYAILVPYCLGGIAGPAIQGYISNSVPDNEQGELQGGLTSLQSVAAILGPLIMTGSFRYFTSAAAPFQFPGVQFILGAIFMLISAVLAVRSFKRNKPVA
jgi:DHA1 family tetracycline resistance protein-like MFS transporter